MSTFFLIDCNNFFVSCERVFRPDLVNKPVAVLSNNDGCIIARSNEVKALGIPMGAPYFKFKKVLKEHRVTLFSSNFELYADMSARIMDILSQFSPNVEIYSIDEAFLEVSSLPDPCGFARVIHHTITKSTSIPTSIGIAETKTLAKLANHFAKEDKKPYWHFPTAPGEHVLSHVPVTDIWGIGRRIGKRLKKFGITNTWQFKTAVPTLIKQQLGINGLKTQQELGGIKRLNLEDNPQTRKGILSSRSFGKKVTDIHTLKAALAANIHIACKKLRHQHSHTSFISIFIRSSPHSIRPYSAGTFTALYQATNCTITLITHVHELLQSIYKDGIDYVKSGVFLSHITPEVTQQLSYLHTETKTTALMPYMDHINTNIHENGLFPAIIRKNQETYKMSQDKRSPRYTTRWRELQIIEI